MIAVRIGIVGAGPRGLTVLERIIAHERAFASAELQIYVFDPQPPGVGCHDPRQDDHLLVNTVASQITLFSDESVKGAGPILSGPSFYEWLRDDSHLLERHEKLTTPVAPDGYYPRALFGHYLHWVYHYLVALAPAHVKVTLVREAVERADDLPGEGWVLKAPSAAYFVNYLYLTTGHTKPKEPVLPVASHPTQVIRDPYPVRRTLDPIGAGMTVGIEGLGLSTCDVIAELTVGRGGRFVETGPAQWRYQPSGREPRIVAFSRSGIPLTARAKNQKGTSGQYRARFLLADRIRDLRAGGKLDFQKQVFPLLLADMQYAYYEALLKKQRDPVVAMLFLNQFLCADAAERDSLINQYVKPEDRFSWDRLAQPIPHEALASSTAFDRWLRAHLEGDIAEALQGNVDSPLKAACDVVRDLRDNLRAAIDHAGLTEESHRWLLSEFVPIMNRIAVGPPVSRVIEMLALMDAGVLSVGYGPGPQCAADARGHLQLTAAPWPERTVTLDTLIKARVSMHSPAVDSSTLMRGLLQDGHVRLFHNGGFHAGGIEVTREFNLVSANGETKHNAWALGIPVEGVKFYTFVVPRPGVNSTAIVDAGRAVTKMLSAIADPTSMSAQVESESRVMPTQEYASAFASLFGALS